MPSSTTELTLGDLHFAVPQLEDVETLNSWALQKRLDVTKISCHALGHVLDEYCVLSAGSALGRGCGPLLVAASEIVLLTDLVGKRGGDPRPADNRRPAVPPHSAELQ